MKQTVTEGGTVVPSKQKPDVLLCKARDDQRLVVQSMVDGGLGTEDQVGFFCQQAVEKAIKAVLEERGIAYRFTHDLSELIDVLIDHAIEYPSEMDASVDLTPFAARMRYDYLPTHATADEPFDQDAAMRTIDWASEIVKFTRGT